MKADVGMSTLSLSFWSSFSFFQTDNMTPSNLDDMLGSDYQNHGGVLKGLTVPFFAMGGIPGYRQQCHSNASVCKKDFEDPEPHTIFFPF